MAKIKNRNTIQDQEKLLKKLDLSIYNKKLEIADYFEAYSFFKYKAMFKKARAICHFSLKCFLMDMKCIRLICVDEIFSLKLPIKTNDDKVFNANIVLDKNIEDEIIGNILSFIPKKWINDRRCHLKSK